jgi:GT2 family glycosyltransferase
MLDLSVVIPARNAGHTLGMQLSALSVQEFDGSWEVIVADHGSTDTTRAVAELAGPSFPEFRVIDAADASGVSAVRNAGCRAARGSKITFCDADDVVTPDWLAAMSKALENHDAVGGSLRLGLLNSPRVSGWRSRGLVGHLNTWPGYLPWAIGANFAIRTEVFRELGGFDERFPMNGAEDVELCWRLQLAGYSLGFAPDAAIEYRMRETMTDSLRQAYRYAKHEAHLYKRFRSSGMPRRRWSVVAKAWVRLPVDLLSG